jgi:hypothetical protein
MRNVESFSALLTILYATCPPFRETAAVNIVMAGMIISITLITAALDIPMKVMMQAAQLEG